MTLTIRCKPLMESNKNGVIGEDHEISIIEEPKN